MKRLTQIIWIAVSLSFYLTCRANEDQPPVARNGVIDLRNTDLFGKSLSIKGDWGFYWSRLLTPDSLSGTTTTPDYVTFPRLWNDLRVHGRPLSPIGYGTYTLTILLPARRPRIGMEVPDAY